ncbi:hypothetical protein [Paraburkholderia kururiensis]|uniref:hypothetical protein n=1 Tax=Paraburkholderia kururiensis TaxID=984307 RepID=UPI00126826C6|nr:hypothetical protein [Paraburkholderia kururiensis]
MNSVDVLNLAHSGNSSVLQNLTDPGHVWKGYPSAPGPSSPAAQDAPAAATPPTAAGSSLSAPTQAVNRQYNPNALYGATQTANSQQAKSLLGS